MISREDAQKMLERIWQELKSSRRYTFFSSPDWKESFEPKSGVYAVWEKGEERPVYAGETANLKERMSDFEDSRHHTLRRTIGKKKFEHMEGFEKATTKKKFPEHIEKLVGNYFRENLMVACLPIYFGRKEVEEYIDEKFHPTYHRRKRRRKGD
ncbi:unnamed protein product [marine sediment metagenome]|uniref:GIY-YIG domain-containing protein n=1 Tax=marine sediment metagenome TaxID=412755 RepID=X1BV06_9ZZZZ